MPTKTDTRVATIKRLFREGKTFREIGDEIGVSGQRVDQIIRAADPNFVKRELEKRQKKADADRIAKADAERKAREKAKGKCRICGQQIPADRASKYTDRPECQRVWNRIRFHIDPERAYQHRLYQAKTILNPDSEVNYSQAQIDWAKAVVSDNPPPLNPPAFSNQNPDGPYGTFEAWKAEYPEMYAKVEKAWKKYQ